jgi:hypothetical protein
MASDHSGTADQICWQTAQLTRQTATYSRLTVAFKNIYAESLGAIAAKILCERNRPMDLMEYVAAQAPL